MSGSAAAVAYPASFVAVDCLRVAPSADAGTGPRTIAVAGDAAFAIAVVNGVAGCAAGPCLSGAQR